MAIFKDFIDQVTFSEVWAIMGQENQKMEEYEASFRAIFEELKAAQPEENKEHMTIRFVMEEAPLWDFYFDDETEETEEADEGPTLQVYGFKPGDEEGYAIGLKAPELLVGLAVDEETAKAYTPAEIVSHCMAEMTYTSTMASSAYGTEKDMAGGGLLASQNCISEDITNVNLDALRAELGAMKAEPASPYAAVDFGMKSENTVKKEEKTITGSVEGIRSQEVAGNTVYYFRVMKQWYSVKADDWEEAVLLQENMEVAVTVETDARGAILPAKKVEFITDTL